MNNITWPQIAAAVYQACTNYDQYLPQLSADVARSWAKTFAYFDLKTDDLIGGVDRLYAEKGDGYRPLPADIARVARELRRERAEREPDEVLTARQEALAAKAKEDAAELAARKGLPVAEAKFRRPVSNHLRVACPWCHASVGQRCVVPGTDVVFTRQCAHPARLELLA
jgi:hypothetical protein